MASSRKTNLPCMSIERRSQLPPIPQLDRPDPDRHENDDLTEINLPENMTVELSESDLEPADDDETITLTEADLDPEEDEESTSIRLTEADLDPEEDETGRPDTKTRPYELGELENAETLLRKSMSEDQNSDRTKVSPPPDDMTLTLDEGDMLNMAREDVERSDLLESAEIEVSPPEYEEEEIKIDMDPKEVERLDFGLQFDQALDEIRKFAQREYPTEKKKERSRRRKFNRLVRRLATSIELDPLGAQKTEGLLWHEERLQSFQKAEKGTPFMVLAEGRRLFAAVGLKLFERDPHGFAERFGYGHQMFTPRAERIKIVTRLVSRDSNGPTRSIENLIESKVLLPEEVTGILYGLKGRKKEELAAKVETSQEGDPLWETKKLLEKIRRYGELRENLTAAVQLEMPELALLDEEKSEQEEDLSGQINKIIPIGQGETAPLSARVKGRAGKSVFGVYKPDLHEPGNAHGDGTGGIHFRISQRKGDTAGSEVLVSLVGMLCGMRRTLPTTYTNGPAGPGTIQHMVQGEVLARSYDWLDGADVSAEYRDDLGDIAALDALTVGSDRHANNMIINHESRAVYPIDNGLNFVEHNVPIEEIADSIADMLGRTDLIGKPLEEMDDQDHLEIQDSYRSYAFYNDIISMPVALFEGKNIGSELYSRLVRLQEVLNKENGKVHRTLLETHKLFFGEKKGQRLFNCLKTRLDSLVDTKVFSKNSPAFDLLMGKSLRRKIERSMNRKAEKKLPQPPPLPKRTSDN